MAKETAPAELTQVDSLDLPEQTHEVTLDDFCRDASLTDTRVELLSAFAAMERAAGSVKAPPAIFAERYAAFANEPA